MNELPYWLLLLGWVVTLYIIFRKPKSPPPNVYRVDFSALPELIYRLDALEKELDKVKREIKNGNSK